MNKYNRLMVFMVFALIACILTVGSASAADTTDTTGLANSSYPEYGINSNHTSQSNYTGPQTNTILWTKSISTGTSAVATGSKGIIYVGAQNGTLYALKPNGKILWTHDFGSEIVNPAVSKNGAIYVTTQGGSALYALNPDGSPLWTCSGISVGSLDNFPAIGSDGTIYVGGNSLYAIYPNNGSVEWTYTPPYAVSGTPAIDSNGIIYFATYTDENNKLYALNPNGTLNWTCTIGTAIYNSPAIGSDGTIYIGCWDTTSYANGKLYAINPTDGSVKWIYTTSYYEIIGTPAISSDGTIYVVNVDSWDSYKLFAIKSDGTPKWNYTLNGHAIQSTSATIGADGTIYIGTLPQTGTAHGTIYAIDPNGNLKWNYETNGSIIGAPVIGSDGTLYIESYKIRTIDTATLYAISDPLANALPDGGYYKTVQNVVLTSTKGGTIYYTTDGTDPTSSGTKYTGAITINGIKTLKFAVLDNSGNWSPVYTENYTIDSTSPTVVKVNPVSTSSSSTNITFSEPVKLGNNHILLKNSDGTSIPFKTSINGNIITIKPLSPLSTGKYILTLDEGSVTDLTGNSLSAYSTAFTLDTSISPVLTASPSWGVYNTIQNVILTSANGGTIYYTANGSAPTNSSTKYTGPLTLTKTTALKFAALDNSGNWSLLYTGKYTKDTESPTIVKVNPANTSSSKYVSSINITFNEAIKLGTGSIILKNRAGRGIALTTSTKNNILTIVPTSLAAGSYTLTIGTGSVTDLAGNAITSYSNQFTLDKTAPKVSAVNPKNKATGVLRTKIVSIKLSENVHKSIAWHKIYVKNLKTGKKIKSTLWISKNHIYIKTSKKTAKTWYQIYIAPAAIKDVAGNNLTAPYTFKFKTGKY